MEIVDELGPKSASCSQIIEFRPHAKIWTLALQNAVNLIGNFVVDVQTELVQPKTARQRLKSTIFLVQLEWDCLNKNISKRF